MVWDSCEDLCGLSSNPTQHAFLMSLLSLGIMTQVCSISGSGMIFRLLLGFLPYFPHQSSDPVGSECHPI